MFFGGPGMWGWGGGWGFPGMFFLGPIFMAVFVWLVIRAIWGPRRLYGGYGGHWGHGCHGGDRDALHIAERRYAQGEISADELNEIRKNLHH